MRKLILLTFIALLLPGAARSEALSLDSCRAFALANNKQIKMADEAVRGAGYVKKSAFAAYLPGIDFTAGYMYNQHIIELLGEDAKLPTMTFNPATQQYDYNLVKMPDGTPVKDPATGSYIPSEVAVIPKEAMSYDVHNVFAGAFTLTQPIYMGGQIRALNDMAKAGEEVAVSARNVAVQDLLYSVDEAYWLVVSLRSKQKLAEGYVALVDSLNYSVTKLLENGMATRSDLLNVEVKLNEARIAYTKVTNGLSLARMALQQLCGLPIGAPLTLADEETMATPKVERLPDYDLQQVYQRRQDLEALRRSISLLRGKEKLSLSAMLPKIAAVGTYAFSNPNVIHGFEKRFGGGFSVGAALTIPLWHWGGNYHQYRAAKSATLAQQLLLEDMEEKVELQVNQAKYKFEEAYKTLDMTRTNMEKADENLRNAELGYKEGVLTVDDVTAAQTAWLQAHSEEVDAEIGVQLCNVYLSKVLGLMPY
ncbi:MAG: TolC family protein [Muribaculaceae bacterium]|nr:TolC family protein [Muribaculaceae bacterium]